MVMKLDRQKIDSSMFLVLRSIFHYERKIAAQFGLDFVEIYAMQYLRYHPAARVTDLSTELALPMFSISRLVQRLVANGYVSRQKDTVDKRNVHLTLKEAGLQVLKQIEDKSYEQVRLNASKVTDLEMEEIVHSANKLHVILGVTDQVLPKS